MSGRMVRRTLRWATRLVTALLVMLALLVVAGRSLVADISRFHAPLEQWLSQRIGAEVRFDNVRGEWLRASPELFFDNVRIAGEQTEDAAALHISRLALRLNIARTLQHMTPRLRLRVQGLQATAHCEGMRCRINGLVPGETGDTGNSGFRHALSLAALVAARPQITLNDSRLRVDGLYDRLTEVRLPSVKVWWEAGIGWVSGRVTVSGPDQLDLTLSGRVEPEDAGRFQALLHWRMTQTDLMSWVPPVVSSSMPVHAAGGRGTTLVWLRLDQQGIVSATADIDWHDLSLRPDTGAAVALHDVGGQWRWMRSDNGHWTLAARQLKLKGEGFSWRPSSVFLESSVAADASRYRLRLADVRIQGSFRSLLEGLDQHHPTRQWLLGLQPVGRIQDLDVKVEKGADGWRWRSGRASLRDVTWQAWQKVPGMSGISATLWLKPAAVWVSLDATDTVLDYPAMMRSPIVMRHLRGNLGIDWSTRDIQVSTGVIDAATDELSAATRLHVRIPRDAPDDPGQLSLQVTLRDGNAAQVSRYLPAGLISTPLLAWLDGAIRGGVLEQGDILVNGPLRKTPEPLDTSVMLGFRVRDASLRFLPDWEQPVEGLRGDVIVDNGAVAAAVQEGRYFGLQLHDGEVMTHRSSPEGPLYLSVRVSGQGDAAGALPILRDTPLGKVLRAPLTGLAPEGLLTARLDLDAPLQAGVPIKGKVDVSLPSGKLAWPAYRLQLDNLRLDVSYGMDGSFVTRALQADFLGRTVHGDIVTRNAGRERFTRLAIRGSTRMDALGAWLNVPVTSIAGGEAPWRLDADFYPSRVSLRSAIGFHSDLQGVRLDLPPPFGKAATGKQPLSVSWSLAPSDAVHVFRYGRELSARWSMAGGQVSRLGIRLGHGEASLPATGRVLSGYLSRIDTGEWTQVFNRWTTGGGTKGAPVALAAWAGSQISVGDLTAGSFAVGAMVAGLEGGADTLTLVLSGERLKGRVTAPLSWLESPSSRGNALPVDLHVEHLVLPARTIPTEAPPSDASSLALRETSLLDAEPAVTFDPVLLPFARVRIDDLRLGNEAFGRYALDLVPEPEGVRLDNVSFELKTIRFQGAGHWRSEAGKTRTTLTGNGVVVNVADVMSGFGYAPSMSSRSGQVVADVGWSGAPWQVAVHRSNGSLKATLDEGRFLTVDNNAARRVWGFLNFRTWMRRMQLEFDDLSSKEMTYNKVSGRFLLGQNRLSVEKLRIDSPSIDMKMQGELDLGARELDMVWFVTIPVTRNLMLPAVVVGGLPGAATAFVVDKVLGRQIDRLTTLTYDVKGSFDAPLMEVRTPL